MMRHSALNYIKQISSDKFDPKSFISTNLGDFFKQLASYFLSIHKFDKKKDVVVPFKRAKGGPIIESLDKIISKLGPTDITIAMCPDIDIVFSFLLHPETPADVRIPSTTLFFNLIKSIGFQDCIEALKTSFLVLIPYPKLVRNEEEKLNLMRNYPKTICGFNSGGDQITSEQAHQAFLDCLSFIRQLFASVHSEFALKFLFDDLFSILYYNQVLTAKLNVTRTGGFSKPAPSNLHLDILNFFQQLYTMKDRINLFLENKSGLPILFVILNETISQRKKELVPDTFRVMTLFTDLSLLQIIKEKNKVLHFINIALSTIRVLDDAGIRYASIAANTFLSSYLQSIDTLSRNTSEDICQIIENLYNTIPEPHFAIFLQESIWLYIIASKNQDERLWELILSKVKENPFYATATCRFSQYLATVCLPYLYGFNLTETVNNCKEFVFRAARNRASNPYSFVTEVIEQVVKEPATYIMNHFELGFNTLSNYVKNFESYPFAPIRDPPTNKDEAMELITFYLQHFGNFMSYNDESQQNYIFSILFSFYYGLFRLDKYPPNSFVDTTALFCVCEKELTRICLDDSCSESIKFSSFSILAESINKLSIRDFIDSKSLSHWYSILYLFVLSANVKLSELAFEHAVRSLRIGFVGSSILIPLLLEAIRMKFVPSFLSGNQSHTDLSQTIIDQHIGRVPNPNEVEQQTIISPFMKSLVNNNYTKYLTDMNYDLNNPAVSFLSMAPLFEKNVDIPSQFLNEIRKRCESSKHLYISNFEEVLSSLNDTQKTYKDRVLEGLDQFEKDSSIVTCTTTLIVHELLNDSPNSVYFNELINHLINSITKFQSVESLNMVNVLVTYIEPIIRLSPTSILNLITTLTDEVLKISFSTPPEWIYSSISSLTSLFIHTYSITKDSDDSQRFCSFLAEFSNRNSVDNFPSILFDLANSSLDVMSIYFGNFPFPQSSIFLSNTSLSKNLDNFFSIDNRLIYHAEKQEDQSMHFDVISEVGKFSWNFKAISTEILDTDNISAKQVDIPINDEIEESQKKRTEIISFFNDPICQVIAEYEQQSSTTFQMDSVDDTKVTDFLNLREASLKKVYAGESSFPQIRQNAEGFNSAESPLSALNVLNFSNQTHATRTDLNNIGKTQIEKIEVHGNRKKMKFGVVYVKKGTQDQNQIFNITLEDISPHFREFLTGLGWPVDLATHIGYSGGLDLKGSRSGQTSIYYADFNNEVMFHVGPLLPTAENDDQNVLKKKHIGNDHIYIIYVDNDVDYDPSMISSQFGIVQLMVYPLPSTGLFRVEVFSRKNETPWFGPLRNGTIVRKEALPSLIRNSAITAMANIWFQQKEFFSPILELASLIEDCSTKRAIKDNVPFIVIEDLLELHF